MRANIYWSWSGEGMYDFSQVQGTSKTFHHIACEN